MISFIQIPASRLPSRLDSWLWWLSWQVHLCHGRWQLPLALVLPGPRGRWAWMCRWYLQDFTGGTSKVTKNWGNLQEIQTRTHKQTQILQTKYEPCLNYLSRTFENNFETHLQRNLPIWHAFKLRCKNLPDSTVFLNVQRKRETWHSWTIVKLSWITFFCSKKIRQGNVEYPTNQWRNTK